MEEINNLRLYVEDSVNIKTAERLEDISLAICFLKSRTPVLLNWIGNLERIYILVKIFWKFPRLPVFMINTTLSAHKGTEKSK